MPHFVTIDILCCYPRKLFILLFIMNVDGGEWNVKQKFADVTVLVTD